MRPDIKTFIEDGRKIEAFSMEFRGIFDQRKWEAQNLMLGFRQVNCHTRTYMSGEADDTTVFYERATMLPQKPEMPSWIEPESSCYCAALGTMAPCGWCTDPANDPDREENEE